MIKWRLRAIDLFQYTLLFQYTYAVAELFVWESSVQYYAMVI